MPEWKRALIVMSVAQLLVAVGFSMIFPFLPNYVEALGSTTGLSHVFLAGAVFSAQAVTMMIASPIWGALADRVGRKPMVQRAMFGGAAIILLMAFARSAEELVALRAVQGLITGTVAASSALIAAMTPKERTGFALGTLQTALTSGVALGPIIGGVLADFYGYRAAFIITSVLLLAGGLLVQFGVREEFTPPERTRRLSGMVADWMHILRTPGVGITFAARFTAWLGRGVLVPILPLFMPFLLTDQRLVSTFTGLVIGVAAATATVSAIYLGNLGDRIGHRSVLIGSTTLAMLSYLPMAFVGSAWQLLVLNGLAGIAVGGIMPSLSALLSNVTASEDVGSAFGLDNAIIAASRAVAPLVGVGIASIVAGFASEAMGYRAAFGAGAGLFLLTIVIVVLRMPREIPAPRPVAAD